jgi:hypothetical protein
MKKLHRQPTVPNKYNLTISKIKKLKVNREKVDAFRFWRNDIIHAWCVSGGVGGNLGNGYWLGIYDETAPAYAGKIQISFSSYGGMCGYDFNSFYRPSDIENEIDLQIQELFLEEVNHLIDSGTLIMEEAA